MPIRVGFSKFRRQMLEQELERVTQMMRQLGVKQAILTGDLVTEQVGPESTLDLILVMDIPGKFVRRMDFLTSHLGPMVATNYLVYTPEEFDTLKETSPFLRNAVQGGRVVYGA